jgi:hypothetical protein
VTCEKGRKSEEVEVVTNMVGRVNKHEISRLRLKSLTRLIK